MDISGNHSLPGSRKEIWKFLNDPLVLQACIPGCVSFEQIGEAEYSALVVAKFGPVKAKFKSHISLENLKPPESYTLSGSGQGGVTGFAKGKADIQLEDTDQGTELSYQASMHIGGKLAQVGSRLFKGSVNKITKDFFQNFVAVVEAGGLTE